MIRGVGTVDWILGKTSQKDGSHASTGCPGSGGITILEELQSRGDVALQDVCSGHSGGGLGWVIVVVF